MTLSQRIAQRIAARNFADETSAWIYASLENLTDDQRETFWTQLRTSHAEDLKSELLVVAPMTDDESRAFDSTIIPFGEHFGTRVDEARLGYLVWLADQKDTFKNELKRYVRSQRIQNEQ